MSTDGPIYRELKPLKSPGERWLVSLLLTLVGFASIQQFQPPEPKLIARHLHSIVILREREAAHWSEVVLPLRTVPMCGSNAYLRSDGICVAPIGSGSVTSISMVGDVQTGTASTATTSTALNPTTCLDGTVILQSLAANSNHIACATSDIGLVRVSAGTLQPGRGDGRGEK